MAGINIQAVKANIELHRILIGVLNDLTALRTAYNTHTHKGATSSTDPTTLPGDDSPGSGATGESANLVSALETVKE